MSGNEINRNPANGEIMEICPVCQGTKHIREVVEWDTKRPFNDQRMAWHTCHNCEGTGKVSLQFNELPKPGDGDIMTLEEFAGACDSGCFINSDGMGRYATKDQETNLAAIPSHFANGDIFTKFTHVCWYNK